jgi:hypothetical protein
VRVVLLLAAFVGAPAAPSRLKNLTRKTDAGWTATSIELQSFTGAVPSELSADGGSFSVTWASAANS